MSNYDCFPKHVLLKLFTKAIEGLQKISSEDYDHSLAADIQQRNISTTTINEMNKIIDEYSCSDEFNIKLTLDEYMLDIGSWFAKVMNGKRLLIFDGGEEVMVVGRTPPKIDYKTLEKWDRDFMKRIEEDLKDSKNDNTNIDPLASWLE